MSTPYVIDQARWANMTIFEQMGNIYSEVGRSFSAQRQHNTADQDAAAARAIDLFDATVTSLLDNKSPRVKEVLRSKDQFLQVLYGGADEPANIASLDRYFLQFAIAARLNR